MVRSRRKNANEVHAVHDQPNNRFVTLKKQLEAVATRPFNARGIAIKRCQRCMLAQQHCICPWRVTQNSRLDWVLLVHHDEVFKPTNTGRLIADILPRNTWAFEWSRTCPPDALIQLLQDPKRQCVLLFPASSESTIVTHQQVKSAHKQVTMILLDGTWKQARKMYRTSQWLKGLPHLEFQLDSVTQTQYAVRKAPKTGQLATAESAALALAACGEDMQGQVLSDYFEVFNQHYCASRLNRAVSFGEAHRRLQELAE